MIKKCQQCSKDFEAEMNDIRDYSAATNVNKRH